MEDTTLSGVTLFTSSRTKNDVAFDITISPRGIEIRRPDQEVRLLGWDRVATWEIERRKRNVVLVLRGGGSVTPLLIPNWRVDDLDQLLRDMTAHLTRSMDLPDETPDLVLPEAAPSASEPALPGIAPLDPAPDPAVTGVGTGAAPDLTLPDVAPPEPVVTPPEPEVELELEVELEVEAEVEGPVDLQLAPPLPVEAVEPVREMDLTLPSPPPMADPADSLVDMDLSLPPIAPEGAPPAIVIDVEGEE